MEEIDLWEINEAFALVAMMPINQFNLDYEKVNVNGGAIALGHPIGWQWSTYLYYTDTCNEKPRCSHWFGHTLYWRW